MKKPEETIRTATADIIYALLHIDKGNLDKAYAILESVVVNLNNSGNIIGFDDKLRNDIRGA